MNHLFEYRRALKQVATWSNTERCLAYLLCLLTAIIAQAQTSLNGGVTTSGGQTSIYQPPNISDNRIETAFGRYHRTLSSIIGRAWNAAINSQKPPIPKGSITILASLDPSGKVVSTKVLSPGNDQLATVSLTIIMITPLPPVPTNLAPMLRNGKLPVAFTFSIN